MRKMIGSSSEYKSLQYLKTTYIVKMTQSNHKQESLLLFRFI